MKLAIAATAALMALASTATAGQYVRGYTRNNGTYVQGYNRSAPNNSVYDNYSYKGNTNPYTGKQGTNSYGGSMFGNGANRTRCSPYSVYC